MTDEKEKGWSGGRMEPAAAPRGETNLSIDVNSSYPYQHSTPEKSDTYDVQTSDLVTPTLDLSKEGTPSPRLLPVRTKGIRRELRENRIVLEAVDDGEFRVRERRPIPYWVWGLVAAILTVGFIVLFGEAK